jgi:acetylornithine deacetylase/succinyl-diaminopimelate desuccinylase-like protein
MNRDAIHRHIDAHLDEHIEHVQRWVRKPSVSWDDGGGVRECATLVAESYRALGCTEVEILEGRFHPGVWAVYDAGASVTLHSYCMFDTRPASPAGWSQDPWSAALVARPPYPRVLVGRGAFSAKGPYVAFLNALASIIAVEGRLPVNVLFLAEGEEIMGSPTYRAFVERYRDRLRTAQLSHCVTGAQNARGTVSVGLGLKGMVVLELTATGKAWGHGPASTVHSSAAPSWTRRRFGSPKRWRR